VRNDEFCWRSNPQDQSFEHGIPESELMFSTMRSAALLVLLASCATALHAPATIHSANAKAPAAPALRSNALRLKGGGPIKAPPTEVVVRPPVPLGKRGKEDVAARDERVKDGPK
jgi:hypothetical protein